MDSSAHSDAYWDANRLAEVSKKETSVDKMMAQLRSYPVYYWTEKVLKVLFTGYIPAPKEKAPLFYIGMMNTTISGNALEGVRVRAGGMTRHGLIRICSAGDMWRTVSATNV